MTSSKDNGHLFPWKWYLSDLPKPDRGRAFSCFASYGGSSMGYKLAGFEVVGFNEITPRIGEFYRNLFHPKHSFVCDIRDMADMMDFPADLYDLDILDGSPPCSDFSKMNNKGVSRVGVDGVYHKEGDTEQRLDDLFFHFIKLAGKLKPKVVVAENVKGLLRPALKGVVSKIRKGFDGAGYNVRCYLLNAKFMGVPQSRERIFFIGIRKDLPSNFPDMAFAEQPIPVGMVMEKGERRPYSRLTKDGTLRKLRASLNGVKPSEVFLTLTTDRDSSPKLQLGENLFYPTTQDVRNIATFPQDYPEMGGDAPYATGHCVPPVMMAQIATRIWEGVLSKLRP